MATLPPPTSPDSTPDAADLSADVLVACLRNTARGDRRHEAAVGLLIDYGHWLTDPEFVDHCVCIVQPDGGGYPLGVINWAAAQTHVHRSGQHGSAEAVLLWACELVGVDTRVPAVQLLARMDDRAARLAIVAAKHTSRLHPVDDPADVLGEVA